MTYFPFKVEVMNNIQKKRINDNNSQLKIRTL